MKSILLATTAAVVMTAHCQAADIRFNPASTSTAPTIVITGTFESGDFAKFRTYADKISAGSKVVVTLDSNGGRLAEGLDIGTAIANRGFATIANHKCLSACALTWLAGARRAVYPDTHIGFHAAYRSEDKQESGVANALVGSYLTANGVFAQMADKKSESKPVPPPSSAKPDSFAVCLAEAGHFHGAQPTTEPLRQYMAE